MEKKTDLGVSKKEEEEKQRFSCLFLCLFLFCFLSVSGDSPSLLYFAHCSMKDFFNVKMKTGPTIL